MMARVPVNISDVEDEGLDWGKDHSDEEFEFNKISDVNNMRDLTPMAWERKDEHYDAYDSIASVLSSFDQYGTDLLSNQRQLLHGLDRSVGSSICIYGRVAVATPVCNIICKCLSSNCVECKKQHDKSSIKTNEIIFIADSGASATFIYDINDFSEYEKLLVPGEAHTANEGKPLKIVDKGTIFMRHEVHTGLWVNI